MKKNLTKTEFCKGVQCPKILWMDAHMPEQAADTASKNVLKTGSRVGELARNYYGSYSLVKYEKNKEKMIAETQRLMEEGAENIAEAAFSYNGLYCAVDILHRVNDSWDIIEVKSSTHISDIYFEDMAFQNYVLSQCGVKVRRVCCLYINNEYTRRGELNLKELFKLEDCTERIRKLCETVAERAAVMREYADLEEEPQKDIGYYCDKPYECAYAGYCGRHLPEKSVFDIARLEKDKKYKLYYEGIVSYEQLHKNKDKLNDKQQRQVEMSLYKKQDEYNVAEIKSFLNTLSYPLYHLDFETFQQAVPEYEGCRPYESIPFQYSIHIEHMDGKLEHREFLAEAGCDPRRSLAEQLVADIPPDACVTAYKMSVEKKVIHDLAKLFPDLSERLMSIHDHVHDLMVPFQKQYYYSAAMEGFYTIKKVLPALYPDDPELDYHHLEGVHNGLEASAAFAELAGKPEEEVKVIRQQLLKYCGLDTYALVKVLRRLKEVVGQSTETTDIS